MANTPKHSESTDPKALTIARVSNSSKTKKCKGFGHECPLYYFEKPDDEYCYYC